MAGPPDEWSRLDRSQQRDVDFVLWLGKTVTFLPPPVTAWRIERLRVSLRRGRALIAADVVAIIVLGLAASVYFLVLLIPVAAAVRVGWRKIGPGADERLDAAAVATARRGVGAQASAR